MNQAEADLRLERLGVALRIEQLEAALTGLVDAISPDGRDNKCEPYFREPLKRARRALANVEAARTGANT